MIRRFLLVYLLGALGGLIGWASTTVVIAFGFASGCAAFVTMIVVGVVAITAVATHQLGRREREDDPRYLDTTVTEEVD